MDPAARKSYYAQKRGAATRELVILHVGISLHTDLHRCGIKEIQFHLLICRDAPIFLFLFLFICLREYRLLLIERKF